MTWLSKLCKTLLERKWFGIKRKVEKNSQKAKVSYDVMNIVGSRRSIGRVHNVQFSPKFSQKKTSYLSHVPKIQNFVVSESPIICKVNENQGWELDLWFFVRIARFLESERAISCFHFFAKSDKSKSLSPHFSNERQEQVTLIALFM